jgi:hypothetical protein
VNGHGPTRAIFEMFTQGESTRAAASAGLSDEVCVVVVTDSALVAGKGTNDHEHHLGVRERDF